MTSTEVAERFRALRVVPVIVIEDAARAASLAGALSEGGLPCAEVTFRTKSAADAIRRMRDAQPDMLIGAGTVLTPTQADSALDAGATFIVAPGFSPVVVDYCLERDVPIFPGTCTPSEVEAALMRGLRVVKFFPAEPAGGLPYLKAMAAPYGEVSFMPTGGITRANLPSYLAFPRVVACGGSWMAPAEWIAKGDFEAIRAETERTVAATREPVAR
jgi:2-dehydro-3-deoxyphosphogluconate aldolase/(4S)-4-hydroxy-2-oxoglutarate aldolase